MKYKAAPGAMFNDETAQIFGERIEVLVEENNGDITPELILQDAQAASSPFNEYIEWDDASAAFSWRIQQCRQIVNHINAVIENKDGTEEEIRAFVSVIVVKEKTSERVYAPLTRVMTDAELHRQMVEDALKELIGWRKRYAQYSELEKIFAVIEEIKQEVLAV